MTPDLPAASAAPTASPAPALPAPTASPTPPVASPEARLLARTILEVLAGLRSITDAGMALGVTPARYQQLEARAIAGLIAACEPRPPGPVPGAALPGELVRLRAERDRLAAEVNRYQALLRISQQAFGGPPVPQEPPARARASDLPGAQVARAQITRSTTKAGKLRKQRTPTVRAMRLAKRVADASAGPATAPNGAPPVAGATAPATPVPPVGG